MAVRDFFVPEARRRVGQAVEEIERETSAEVVVTVRKRSGHYRQTDLYAGAAFALAMLAFLLFDAHPFDVGWMPVDVIVAFGVGAFASAEVTLLRRALTSPRLLRESTVTAARAAFYELGISRTTGRTGVLVYVSMFERRVVVVPDIAVKPDELGAEWTAAEQALQASVANGPDFERFLTALASIHAPLVRALPAQPGDVNELPNEPVMA
jgi:putative membrane protein